MAKLNLQALRVFCLPLAPEVFEFVHLNGRAVLGDLKQQFPDTAALQTALDALVEKGWLLHKDAFPEFPEFRDFASYIMTAPGMEMARMLGLERPGLGAMAARFMQRLRESMQSVD
jgi:hypothetical protein